MWPRAKIGLMGLLLVLAAGSVRAQEAVLVQIETNWPEATVFADTVRLGPAARGAFVVPPGTRQIRLMPPGDDVWSIQPVTAPLDAAPGDTLVLALAFPYHYRVESIPFGARVSVETPGGRQSLGETPLLHQSERPLTGSMVVEANGYVPERVEPGVAIWNRHLLTLQPLTLQEAPTAEMVWSPPKKRRNWIDYTAAAVALGAGALAVHYKFKGDRLDERYRDTGDPALRSRIRSFDTRSFVALGVMQTGVAVLAVRFVLR